MGKNPPVFPLLRGTGITRERIMISDTLAERIDREIHGLLADIGIIEQRTDEFVSQDDLVKRFMRAWAKVVDTIEETVIAQIDRGKMKVKV